jgi:hypothetical protein
MGDPTKDFLDALEHRFPFFSSSRTLVIALLVGYQDSMGHGLQRIADGARRDGRTPNA